MLATQALRGWGRYPEKHWSLMQQNYISKPTWLLLHAHDHMLPSCTQYVHFVHVDYLCSISCPFWHSMLFYRSLNKIFTNTWHSPSFLPLATHTWWQEAGPSPDYQAPLTSPNQTDFFFFFQIKVEIPQHHQPLLLKPFSNIVLNLWRNIPRNNFYK